MSTLRHQAPKDLAHVISKAVTEAIVAMPTSETPNKIVGHKLMKRPVAGGRCAAVWDQLDRMRASGKEPTLAMIQKYGAKRRWNKNNTRIEFYRWRNHASAR